LPSPPHAAVALHLHGCAGCAAYVEQMRTTGRLLGSLPAEEIDRQFCGRLVAAFRSRRGSSGAGAVAESGPEAGAGRRVQAVRRQMAQRSDGTPDLVEVPFAALTGGEMVHEPAFGRRVELGLQVGGDELDELIAGHTGHWSDPTPARTSPA